MDAHQESRGINHSRMDDSFGIHEFINNTLTLELTPENIHHKCDQTKILKIICDTITEMSSLDVNNFPNVVLISIKLSRFNLKDFNFFLRQKFNNKLMVIELNTKDINFFYTANELIDGIITKSDIVKKLETNEIIDLKDFLKLLKINNFSLTDPEICNKVQKLFEIPNILLAILDNILRTKKFDKVFVNLIGLVFNYNLTVDVLTGAIKHQSLKIFLMLLNLPSIKSLNEEKFDEILSIDKDFLTNLIKFNNYEVLEALIGKEFFERQISSECLNKMLELSVEYQFFHIFELLKNSRESFMDEKSLHLFLPIANSIHELHELIDEGNYEKVNRFLQFFNPEYRLCYGKSKYCALEYAIESKSFEIYALLRARGFWTNRGAHLDKKISELARYEQKIIFEENMKHKIFDPKSLLLSKCNLDACCDKMNFQNLREMLDILYNNDDLKELFDHAAKSNAQIVFDYRTESVFSMDPTAGQDNMGLFYPRRNLILVGKDQDDESRYGVFAHEITHLVMNLIYDNTCLPYCKFDKEKEMEFDTVFKKTQNFINCNDDAEKVVKWAFELYESEMMQKIELIVRAPHVIAKYIKDPDKLLKLEEEFSDLFCYFRDFVMNDLRHDYVFEITKLNRDLGVYKKITDSIFNPKPTIQSQLLKTSHRVTLILSEAPQITIKKLFIELTKLPMNKLYVRCRNIYATPDNLNICLTRNEIENYFKHGCLDRLIIDANDSESIDLPNVENILIVAHINNEKIKKLEDASLLVDEIKFIDFTPESQQKILNTKISFEDESFCLKSLTEEVSNEILNIISENKFIVECKSETPAIDPNHVEFDRQIEQKVRFHYVENGVTKYYFEYFEKSISNFITAVENDKVTVISDIAGSGKTTLLLDIYETSKDNLESFWISFISLKLHKTELLDEHILTQDFPNFIADKILKLNALEKLVFLKKYKNNEVIILFDAFDEISPDCKKNCIRLFQSHQMLNTSKIYITTRMHLEHDLEQQLQIFAHRLKPINHNQQINFLAKFWQNFPHNHKFDLITNCAKLLIDKVGEIFESSSQFIGVMLQIRILGEYFKDKLNDNFETLIENIKVLKIYRMHFENSVNSKEKLGSHPVFNILTILMPYYEALALRHFLGDDHHYFGLGMPQRNIFNALEELARGGIVQYDANRNVYFMHETFPEYLLGNTLMDCIINPKYVSEKHFESFVVFLFEIIGNKKFQVTRAFLNDLVEENWNTFKESKELSEKIVRELRSDRKKLKFLQFCAEECTFDLSKFLMDLISHQDMNLFKGVVEAGNDETKSNILMKVLARAKNVQKFEIFLGAIFEAYPLKRKLKTFLERSDKDGDTIFHHMARDSVDRGIFLILWQKITSKFSKNETRTFLNLRNNRGRNIFHYVIKYTKHNVAKLNEILKIIKSLLTDDELLYYIEMRDGSGWNVLYRAIQNKEHIFNLIFDFIANLYKYDREQIRHILANESDASGWKNILQVVCKWCPLESVMMVWRKLKEFFTSEEQMQFLFARRKHNGRVLDGNLEAAASNYHLEVFDFVWDLIKENCQSEEDFKYKIFNEKFANFFALTCQHGNAKNFEPVIRKVKGFLGDFEFKVHLLKPTSGDRNLLSMALENPKIETVQATWQMIENHYTNNSIASHFKLVEIFKHTIMIAQTKEIFDFYCDKIMKILGEKKFIQMLKYKTKENENFLHLTAERCKNIEIVIFMLHIIETLLGIELLRIMLMEKDKYGFLPIHYSKRSEKEIIFKLAYEKCLPGIRIEEKLQTSSLQDYARELFLRMQ